MKRDAVDAICALEPYPEGQGADLWAFHRLNNIDKHRLIITVGSSFRSINLSPVLTKMIGFPEGVVLPDLFVKPTDNLFPLSMGSELFVDTPDAEANEKIEFRFDVVLHEPGVIEGKSLTETAVQFRDRISSVVDSFKRFLA